MRDEYLLLAPVASGRRTYQRTGRNSLRRCYENLQKIKTSQSLGMLIITHDLQLARSICADIAVMYAGQIVEYGPQVLTGPRHPYTRLSWQHCRKTLSAAAWPAAITAGSFAGLSVCVRAATAVKTLICRKSRLSMTAAPRK